MTRKLPHELSGRRILVVEDKRLIALDIKDILEGWGCAVVGPVAVDAAIGLIGDEMPDAAILDVHLNGETSGPIADALRAGDRPFLVLTAYQSHHLQGALRDAPLMRKPVDENKLHTLLAQLLSEDSRGSEGSPRLGRS